MKRKLSKSLSIILTMTIVISAIIIAPVTVSAAGTANDIVNVANGEVGVSGSPNKYTYWQAVFQVYLGLKAKMNGKAEVVDTPQRQEI